MDKIYRLFISHSWGYSDSYARVVELIEAGGISFYNHSVPMHDPIHTNGTQKQLREAIDAKMKDTSCIIILAGVYATYSKWINEEIAIANSYNKNIIAIEPWASEKTSAVVKNNATAIVKWQAKSIADAIRIYG